MAELRKARPRKNFTRKNFRYNRDWRFFREEKEMKDLVEHMREENIKHEERLNVDDSSFIAMLFSLLSIFLFVTSMGNGVKAVIITVAAVIVGGVIHVIGTVLTDNNPRNNKFLLGFVIRVISFAILVGSMYLWHF